MMRSYTERNIPKDKHGKTPIITIEMYSVLLDCCTKYYKNLTHLFQIEQHEDFVNKDYIAFSKSQFDNRMKIKFPLLFRDEYKRIAAPQEDDDYDQYALIDFIEYIGKNIMDINEGWNHPRYQNYRYIVCLETSDIYYDFQREINEIFEECGLPFIITDQKNIEGVEDKTIPRRGMEESDLAKKGDIAMNNNNTPIIFLSHKSDDQKYGHALAKLIRGLGVKNEQLIYTSHPLHKIPLGRNIYQYLKSRLGADTYMIFLLSDTYFESSPCLNEMGAAWLAQSDYTSVFVPNFNFQNNKFLECAIDNKQIGVSLNGSGMCKQGMIELRDNLITLFSLSIEDSHWQYLLDEFIDEIK